MSGYYLATLMHLMGSEEFDDETGSCVAGEDTAAFAEVEQIGNQVIFRFETGEENDEGPYAIMEASGDFTLISDESFGGSGSFDETGGAFTFSYDEVSGSDDGMVLCSGAATVDGELPTPVTEQSVADLGIYWFEADSWDSDGDGMCSVCHGADGSGNIALGAPNLTDDIWLYGGKPEQILQSLAIGRNGKMPAQQDILSPEKIHILSAYVYSLSNE